MIYFFFELLYKCCLRISYTPPVYSLIMDDKILIIQMPDIFNVSSIASSPCFSCNQAFCAHYYNAEKELCFRLYCIKLATYNMNEHVRHGLYTCYYSWKIGFICLSQPDTLQNMINGKVTKLARSLLDKSMLHARSAHNRHLPQDTKI